MSCQAGEFILWNLERKNTVKSSVRYKKCEVKNLPLDVKKCEVKKNLQNKTMIFYYNISSNIVARTGNGAFCLDSDKLA